MGFPIAITQLCTPDSIPGFSETPLRMYAQSRAHPWQHRRKQKPFCTGVPPCAAGKTREDTSNILAPKVLSSLILDPRIRHAHRIRFWWTLTLHANRGLDRLAFDRKIFLLAQCECSSDD